MFVYIVTCVFSMNPFKWAHESSHSQEMHMIDSELCSSEEKEFSIFNRNFVYEEVNQELFGGYVGQQVSVGSDNVLENVSDNVLENVSDNVLENVSDNVLENVSEQKIQQKASLETSQEIKYDNKPVKRKKYKKRTSEDYEKKTRGRKENDDKKIKKFLQKLAGLLGNVSDQGLSKKIYRRTRYAFMNYATNCYFSKKEEIGDINESSNNFIARCKDIMDENDELSKDIQGRILETIKLNINKYKNNKR